MDVLATCTKKEHRMKRSLVLAGALAGAALALTASTHAQAPTPSFCRNVASCQVIKDLADKVTKLETRVKALEDAAAKPLMNVQIETRIQDMGQGELCLRWDGTEHSGVVNLLPCKSSPTHRLWNVVPQK